nr:hypothetical protein [Candidatus Saccharibacteria bacterium]
HRTIHGQTIITFGNHLMSDSSLWESPFSTLYGRLPNTSLGPYYLGDADEIDNWEIGLWYDPNAEPVRPDALQLPTQSRVIERLRAKGYELGITPWQTMDDALRHQQEVLDAAYSVYDANEHLIARDTITDPRINTHHTIARTEMRRELREFRRTFELQSLTRGLINAVENQGPSPHDCHVHIHASHLLTDDDKVALLDVLTEETGYIPRPHEDPEFTFEVVMYGSLHANLEEAAHSVAVGAQIAQILVKHIDVVFEYHSGGDSFTRLARKIAVMRALNAPRGAMEPLCQQFLDAGAAANFESMTVETILEELLNIERIV